MLSTRNKARFLSMIIILAMLFSFANVSPAAATGTSHFKIESLASTGSYAIEHNTITGDDRGGIAVSPTHVFYSGDNNTGAFALADLSGGFSVGGLYDGVTSNLATGDVYTLGGASGPIGIGGGTVTRLLEINGSTGALTGGEITLSASIAGNYGSGIFAGYGRVLIHNGSTVYEISLPSGTVTALGTPATPSHNGCESWAYWGVAEHFGGDDYITYIQSSTAIARTRVSDGSTSTVATFSSLSDMCSFTVSLSNNRWYFHHEGTSQFRSGDETIGYADADLSIEVDVSPGNWDFGNQTINTTSAAKSFTLTNHLEVDLNISALSISGEFDLINDLCSGQTISTLGTCTFEVTFSPGSYGAKSGSVSIPSDAPTSSPFLVDLSGIGYNPPPSLDILSVLADAGNLEALINLSDPENNPLSGTIQILSGAGLPTSVTFETLETPCGSTDPSTLSLNGGSIGSTANNGTCTCTPPIDSATLTGPAIVANYNFAGNNTWTFSRGSGYTAWSRITVLYPDASTQSACLFDLTGSGCTTTYLCSGYQWGAAGSASLPAATTAVASQSYTNSTLPTSLDTSTLAAGNYFLYGDASDGFNDPVSDTEPFTLTNEPLLLINPPSDAIAPTASPTQSPLANGAGWNNSDVTVTWNWSDEDGGSGIDNANCTIDSTSTGEGDPITLNATCKDLAGNEGNASYDVKVDKTLPTISAAATAPASPNGAGWYNSNVTVSFTCADAGSGIPAGTCPADQILSTEGAAVASSAQTVTDAADNVSLSSNVVTVQIDKTLPTVSLVGGPADGGSYYFGSVPAAPTCSASDALSGLDGSCTVSGYSAIVGPHTVTATAEDIADNQNSASASYTVLAWTTNGFFQPVDMGGVWNTVKNGSTVPLKFEVFAGSTELTDTSIVNQPLKATQTLCSGGTTDEIELVATGATSLRYDTTDGQFIYNWKTPKKPGYCYVVTVTMADGSTISANFKLK